MKKISGMWLMVFLGIQSGSLAAVPLRVHDCPIYPAWDTSDSLISDYSSDMSLSHDRDTAIVVIPEAGSCRLTRATIANWERLAGESRETLRNIFFTSVAPSLKTTLTEFNNGSWIFRGDRVFIDTDITLPRSFHLPGMIDGTLGKSKMARYQNDATHNIFLGILVVYPRNNQHSIARNPVVTIDGRLPLTYEVDPRVVELHECIDLPVIKDESVVQPFNLRYSRDPFRYENQFTGVTAVGTGTTTGTCTTGTGEMAFTVTVTG
jgi:hypothetical protein